MWKFLLVKTNTSSISKVKAKIFIILRILGHIVSHKLISTYNWRFNRLIDFWFVIRYVLMLGIKKNPQVIRLMNHVSHGFSPIQLVCAAFLYICKDNLSYIPMSKAQSYKETINFHFSLPLEKKTRATHYCKDAHKFFTILYTLHKK